MYVINSSASKRTQHYILSLAFIFLLHSIPTYSQSPTHPWYIGREVGIPVFFGNLKTQLQDQHPISLQYGLSGGYNLHRLFGFELSIDYGSSRLTARQVDYNYFLDQHGKTYSMEEIPGTVPYSQIYSLLKYIGIGLHAPFNLNHIFFPQPDSHRLTFLLSPCFFVNRYKSKIRIKYLHQSWLSPQVHWSFELGTDLLLRYKISNRIDFQVRSGIKYISSKKFDGLSTSLSHNTSYVWISGISFLYKFGKKFLLR